MKTEALKFYHERTFLQDAILSLLNPAVVTDSWDFPFSPEQYRAILKEYFEKDTGFNQETIDKAFGVTSGD